MRIKSAEVVLQSVSEDKPENCSAACEIPVMRPFEGFTYLKKEWFDQEDGIESVSFSMAFSLQGTPVNWDKMQTYVMMPEWGSAPLRRTWVVRIPTHYENEEEFLFHYFFHVKYADGSERVSHAFTQLIMPKTIEYIDHSSDYTHAVMHWSIGGWSYPQNTELEAVGMEWGGEFSVSRAAYQSGTPLYEQGRALKLDALPKPRVFRGKIWAPKGEEVSYCFHLTAPLKNEKGIMFEKWDNNNHKNFQVTI